MTLNMRHLCQISIVLVLTFHHILFFMYYIIYFINLLIWHVEIVDPEPRGDVKAGEVVEAVVVTG